MTGAAWNLVEGTFLSIASITGEMRFSGKLFKRVSRGAFSWQFIREDAKGRPRAFY